MQYRRGIHRRILGVLCGLVLAGTWSNIWGKDDERFFLAHCEFSVISTNNLAEMESYLAKHPSFTAKYVCLARNTTPDEGKAIVRWIASRADLFMESLKEINCDYNLETAESIRPLLEQYITKEQGFTALGHTWWQSEASLPQKAWTLVVSCANRWRRTESPPLLHGKRE